MADLVFGHIDGYPPGSSFESRDELSESRVHRPTQGGIAGSQEFGADSIVLSGGYEDDADFGSEIIYTGQGGRDASTNRQVSDQVLEKMNLALAKSMHEGLPVRVVRGSKNPSPHSPKTGYRYDGLYRVEDYWQERGAAGFRIYRFRLVSMEAGSQTGRTTENEGDYEGPSRLSTTVTRIIRDSEMSRRIKELYNYSCQVCNKRLEGPAGPYAEGAHIRPLGAPHDGPDIEANILCLCPNHHALFDIGAFTIADDFSLIGIEGKLSVHRDHSLDPAMLTYRRDHYG